jgi:hypothetical protein
MGIGQGQGITCRCAYKKGVTKIKSRTTCMIEEANAKGLKHRPIPTRKGE